MNKDLVRLEKRRSMLLDRWLDAENEEKKDLLAELIDIDERLVKKKTEKVPRFTAVPRYVFRSQLF
ncbi:MAG: hypothetical protein KGZ75_06365 [Syntrophomonadaceae bacterium]|jgi:hypothetical protein|nr:hypothetical protein [Syntrophomonadaceae bacterium]